MAITLMYNDLTPYDKLLPFDELYPYFGENVGKPLLKRELYKEQYFKIYNDGGHYVATLPRNAIFKNKKRTVNNSFFDVVFDTFYLRGLQENLKGAKLYDYIKTAIIDNCGEIENLDNEIQKGIDRRKANIHKRLKTFKRKARLNKWTHFVTFTYDSKKMNADTFRSKLRKCLSNFHTRRGWKYMGVFEYAPETHHLHFHALLYVPKDNMVGNVVKITDYSTAQHRMQTTYSNTFFADTFGRNDFEELTEFELKNGNALDYLTKYIAKTGEKIVYSRGIPTTILMKIDYKDIATTMFDFVQKFVLFDDVVDWERDVLGKRYVYEQSDMFSVLTS